MNSTNKKIQLDFGNLPLIEVAVRVSFASPVNLKFGIINDVAQRLRDEFPLLSELKRFEPPPGIREPTLTLQPGSISGADFTGNARGLIVTLQEQLIIARWLKRVEPSATEYPRYATLHDSLWKAVQAFSEACGGTIPPVSVVNMSYVNFLKSTQAQRVLDYFSEMAQIQAVKDARKIYKVEVSWNEKDNIDLRYDLEQVTAEMGQTPVEGYRLKTAAGTRVPQNADPRTALEMIHDRLQAFFQDLISEQAKKEWQLH